MNQGKTIGRFRIGKKIKPGAEGAVWAAEEIIGPDRTRPAAVKVLKGLLDTDDELKARLQREADALIALSAATNVVRILQFGFDEGQAWLAMEYIEKNLADLITDEPAGARHVATMLRDIAQGLRVLHETDPPCLHRDIKPANILVTEHGTYKIADFGLAGAQQADVTMLTPTVRYCAPEMLDVHRSEESPASDLYSLGFVAYEYAVGRRLFREQFCWVRDDQSRERGPADILKWKVWHCDPGLAARPVAEVVPGFPAKLSELIVKLMAKPIGDRYQTAEETLRGLTAISWAEEGSNAAPAPETPASIPPDPRVRPLDSKSSTTGEGGKRGKKLSDEQRLIVLAVAAAVVIVVAVGAFLIRGGPDPVVLSNESVYKTNERTTTVSGQVMDLPDGAKVFYRTRDGRTAELSLDAEGRFSHRAVLSKVGTVEAMFEVVRDGETLSEQYFTIERLNPESVKVTVQVRPSTAGVPVAFMSADGTVLAQATTDAGGRATAPVRFGTFTVQSRDDRYELTGNSRFETGTRPTVTREVQLLQKFLDVKFEVRPVEATVTVTNGAGESRTVQLNERGRASERFKPGRYRVRIEAEQYQPWDEDMEFPRQPDPLVINSSLGQPEEDWLTKLMRMNPQDIDTAMIAMLSDEEFMTFVEHSAALAGLTIETVPQLKKVRITGHVLNDHEFQELSTRLRPCGRRADYTAVRVDPQMISQLVARDLRTAGGKAVRSQVRGQPGEESLHIEITITPELSGERAREIATAYVLDGALIQLLAYRQ